MTLPCDQASDFEGIKKFDDDEGTTCQYIANAYLPSSVAECGEKLGGGPETKAGVLKHVYARCCKPGSKPNGICGFKLTLPCDQASDFEGTKKIGDDEGTTCQDIANAYLPSSIEECGEKLGEGPETKGDALKHVYSQCCKTGSKPNGICGFKLSTSTPCQSKAEGEFLPGKK